MTFTTTRCSLLAVLGLLACSSSSKGPGDAGLDELDEPTGPAVLVDDRWTSGESLACDDGTTTVIGLDQATELGFSPNHVLDYAGGLQRAPLTWLRDPAIDLEPELEQEELLIQIEPRSDNARFRDPDTEEIAHGAVCRSWIEIDVEVTVQSRSRALHERFDATLFSQDVRVAFVAASTEEPRLQGSLRAEREGQPPSRMDLAMALSPLGATGNLSAVWPGVVYPFPTLAYWGTRQCGPKQFAVPAEQAVEGVSPQGMLDAFAALDGVEIEWLDGERTTASVSFEPDGDGSACAWIEEYLDASGMGLQISGTLDLETADGRFRVRTSASLGKTVEPTPTGIYLSTTSNPENTTGIELGFLEIEGLEFQPLYRELQLGVSASGDPEGAIGLNGVRRTNCITEDGQSFCEMTTEQLERGTLQP